VPPTAHHQASETPALPGFWGHRPPSTQSPLLGCTRSEQVLTGGQNLVSAICSLKPRKESRLSAQTVLLILLFLSQHFYTQLFRWFIAFLFLIRDRLFLASAVEGRELLSFLCGAVGLDSDPRSPSMPVSAALPRKPTRRPRFSQ
jgi:hypothetical protein